MSRGASILHRLDRKEANLHSSLLGVMQHCIVSEFTARLPVAFLEIKVL